MIDLNDYYYFVHVVEKKRFFRRGPGAGRTNFAAKPAHCAVGTATSGNADSAPPQGNFISLTQDSFSTAMPEV